MNAMKMTHLGMAAVVLTFAFAGMALQAQAPATGIISGRVLDADTRTPIAGVRVGSVETGWVFTDSDGRYTLQNVSPGRVRLWVEDEVLFTNVSTTAPISVEVAAGPSTPRASDTRSRLAGQILDEFLWVNTSTTAPISVVADGELAISGADFLVRMTGEISGRVLDENGDPVAGARVIAINRVYDDASSMAALGYRTFGVDGWRYSSEWANVFPAMTDDLGRYTLTVQGGRPHWILAYIPQRLEQPVSNAPANVENRSRAWVPAYHPASDSIAGAVPLVVHSRERRTNVDVRMRRTASYCLDATLMAEGSPAPLAFTIAEAEMAQVFERVPQRGQIFKDSPDWTITGESQADGRIRACGLYPGRFTLSAYRFSSQAPGAAPESGGSAQFTIFDADADVHDVKVDALPGLTVRVVPTWDDGGRITASGPEAPRLSAALVRGGVIAASGIADRDAPGEFSFDALPGTYRLRVHEPAPFYIRDVIYEGSSVSQQPFTLASGGGSIRVVLGRDGGTISTVVAGDDASTTAYAAVLIISAGAQSELDLVQTLTAGFTDETGSYTSPVLSPGRYYVLATADPPPHRVLFPAALQLDMTPENLALVLRIRTQGELVEVTPGSSQQLRVTARP